MTDLASLAMDAHGGIDRWRRLKTVSAHLLTGGVLWALKGKNRMLNDIDVTVDLRRQWASHRPFGQPHRRTSFQPERVAIETSDGTIVEERWAPRQSFEGHVLDTAWTDLQLAYFAGYAMWTYLNTPFLFAMPGVVTEEVEPWRENGETWRRLQASFPESVATHSRTQTFYFDRGGLLRRHDYEVDVSGGIPAAQYVGEHREFSGISVPTRRMVFGRQADGRPVPEPLIVSIELSDVEFR